MTAFYVKSGSGVAEFAQSTAYSSGDRMVPKRADTAGQYLSGRRWVWECTTAGTSAAAEPTWVSSVTQDVTTITSGTATFTARRPGYSSGTTADWTFATIYAEYANGALGATGDVVYFSDSHDESYAEAISLGGVGYSYICVDDSAAPPTTASTGAKVKTLGAFDIAISSVPYIRGIEFTCGVGSASNCQVNMGAGSTVEECSAIVATTSNSASTRIAVGATCKNLSVKFAAAAQGILVRPSLEH